MKTADKQELQKSKTYYIVNLHNMRIEKFRIRNLWEGGTYYIADGSRTTDKNQPLFSSCLSRKGLKHTYRNKDKAKNFLRKKLKEQLKACEQF